MFMFASGVKKERRL